MSALGEGVAGEESDVPNQERSLLRATLENLISIDSRSQSSYGGTIGSKVEASLIILQ